PPPPPAQAPKPADPSPSQSTAPKANEQPAEVQPADSQKASIASESTTNEKNDQPDEGRPTIPVRVNEVNVVFTVTDKHNRYVKDLKRDDFKVIDDENPVEALRSFRRESDLPLQVGLLIDASGSIRDRFKFEQESAIEFLNETVRVHFDKAFVL